MSAELLQVTLKLSLVIFMVGNLLDMGLRLRMREAIEGLKNVRFVTLSLLWGFLLCPALAYLITAVVPLPKPYALGLMLLALAPCAPFLPMMVERAKGSLGDSAAFMLLASVFTVVYMPFAVPLVAKGLTASALTIAKPLVLFLLVPLAAGLAIQHYYPQAAARLHPWVKKATGIDTILMLIICVIVYAKGFAEAVGTYAIGAQILFFTIATIASYVFSIGLTPGQKSVLALGMSTRNLGAAFAPLFAIQDVDQRAIIMVALGVPMQTIFSLLAATWLGRRAAKTAPATARP
jgi:bile acid:Na+ symporter, BASS family